MTGRREWLAGLGLIVAVFVAYAPVTRNGFVSFDDPAYITANPMVSQGLTWEGVRWAFGERVSDNWHPLTWLSHMLDAELFGLDPLGHHLVSVGLHAASGVLLLSALRLLTGAFWSSLAVAVSFALHPQRVESVAWASERKDVLSCLFFMLALVAYARFVRDRSWSSRLALLGSALLGSLAKPMMVILPVLLLLLDAWPIGRFDGLAPAARRREVMRALREKSALFAIALGVGVATLRIQTGTGAAQSLEAIPAADRIANALVSLTAYLRQALYPVDLGFFYPHPSLVAEPQGWPLPVAAVGAALVCAVLTGVAVSRRREQPYLLFGWCWYVLGLAPVIGLIQVGSQARADRYTLIPMIGISVAAVWWVRDGWLELARTRPAFRPGGAARRVGVGLLVLATLLLMAGTARQVETWRDDFSLYGRALALDARNPVAHNNLGLAWERRGDAARAESHYRAALAARPEHVESLNNLAILLRRRGEEPAAAELLEEAVRLDPRMARAHVNLGSLRAAQGQHAAAARHWRLALDLVAQGERGVIHANLAGLLVLDGRSAEAESHYRAAMALEPEQALHAHRLGSLLALRGDDAEAIRQQRAALELDPDLLPAVAELVTLLLEAEDPAVRDADEALRWARHGVEASGRRVPRLLALQAAAHFARAEYAEAVRWQRRAAGLTSSGDRAPLQQTLAEYEAALAAAERAPR